VSGPTAFSCVKEALAHEKRRPGWGCKGGAGVKLSNPVADSGPC